MTIQALNRLSYYHRFLEQLQLKNVSLTTATAIADELKINEVVVRKDLSLIRSGKGRPNTGFSVDEMLQRIEACLGYNNNTDAVIVGVGMFGQTIISSMAQQKTGMRIVAGFDSDPALCGRSIGDIDVFPIGKLKDLCLRMHIKVGIIAVPENDAQAVCNLLASSGIRYIMNYAQLFLEAPPGVFVQNENPAASVMAFLQYIRTEEQNKQPIACGQE